MERKGRKQALAESFVASLLGREPELVQGGGGMRVLRDVVNMRSDKKETLVLRSCTLPFWQECINVVNTPGTTRVCAVGSPGIGKSTTTSWLIKVLLEKGKTVVYLDRSPREDGFYVRFAPAPDHRAASVVLYPESIATSNLPGTTTDPDLYLIIDPQETKDSSNPSQHVRCKVIINSSPDSCHWGGNEFAKARDGKEGGRFLYYPLWTLEELRAARPFVNDKLTPDEVETRFDRFGGVPRIVLGPPVRVEEAAVAQEKGLNKLTAEQARKIILGTVSTIDTMDATMPPSSVVGYESSDPFTRSKIRLISNHVGNSMWLKFLKDIWRCFFSKGEEATYKTRPAVGKKSGQKKVTPTETTLPLCTKMECVSDLWDAVRESTAERVLFYSSNKQFPLIDFAFKVKGQYYAVQVTLGKQHSSKKEMINDAVERLKLGPGQKLQLHYAVPDFRFDEFVTKPVDPSTQQCTVNVISISAPTDDVVANVALMTELKALGD